MKKNENTNNAILYNMMKERTFWQIIHKSIEQKETLDKNDQGDQIMNILSEMPNKDIVGFHFAMENLRDNLDSDFMREIAFMMGYNKNETAYRGFRSWIIFLGEEHYNKALKSPSHLLSLDDPNLFVVGRPYFNDLDYVCSGAFYEKNGLDADWDEELQKYGSQRRLEQLRTISKKRPDLDNDKQR